jgi:hypothetical protein
MIYNENYQKFLGIWDYWLTILAYIALGIFVVLSIYYYVNLLMKSDAKDKYDYINENEIKLFWRSMLILTVAGGVILNTSIFFSVNEELIWFFVRLFVTASFATVLALIFNSLIKVYYPFQVEKKLNKLRHKTRVNPNNGNKMVLQSEEDEDKYLDKKMIEEEAKHAVDYDVIIAAAVSSLIESGKLISLLASIRRVSA